MNPRLGKPLTQLQIDELYTKKRGRGRPMLRDEWGRRILEVLKTNPDGLEPAELQNLTGLEPHQIAQGMKWLRDTSHDGPPCLYVMSDHRYYAAGSWLNQLTPGVRAGFIQRAVTLVGSAEKLLSQAEDQPQFTANRREIRRFLRDAARVREDAEDLVTSLQ